LKQSCSIQTPILVDGHRPLQASSKTASASSSEALSTILQLQEVSMTSVSNGLLPIAVGENARL